MATLSGSEFAELRNLYESVYTQTKVEENVDLSDEELDEILEEVVIELLDEGYDIEEIEESFDDELVEEIIMELNPYAAAGSKEARRYNRASTATKRGAARKAAVKGAVKAAGEKAKEVKSEVGRRAGNVAVRAKAGATRAAMKATGVSPMDVPTKAGKQRKSADTFVAGRKVDRDSAKKVMGAKVKAKASEVASKTKAKAAGVAVDAAMAGSAAKRKAKETASAAKSAVKGAASSAKRGLKGLIRRGAEKVASGATKVAKRMSEEVETYDVVVEFLCDYGIAEDLQEAQWLMVNEMDSEDIATILEAYGLTEAGRMHSSSAQQAGFKRINDMESGGPGAGKVRSDDEIGKEKGGQAFLDKIAATKKKMK